jgi:hypothetical protein
MADKDFKVKTGIDLPSPLPASEGGTGQTSLSNAFNALLPAQSGHANKFLQSDGTNTSWALAFPRGNTASRPGSPTAGDIYVNTETGFIEIYTGATYGWEQVGGIASTVTGVTATNQGSGRAFNNGQASIAFTPGTILGRTYTATSSPGGFTGTASSSPITITGLQSSTQYTYTVVASNNYGTSAASAASAGVTATTVPQAPTIGTATTSGTEALITFTPGATGGAAATYTATSSPGGLTGTSSSSPITVSNLVDGQTYTFTVTATNSNGTSLASAASNSITVALDPGSMFAIASFTVPAAGLSSIDFQNIPSTYKHLQLRGTMRTNDTGTFNNQTLRINNDSGSNYSFHQMFGQGSGSPTSGSSVNQTSINDFMRASADSLAAGIFGVVIVDILDYTSTDKSKTVRCFTGGDSNGAGIIGLVSGVWRVSNTAINRLTINPSGGTALANSTFTLYGVKG